MAGESSIKTVRYSDHDATLGTADLSFLGCLFREETPFPFFSIKFPLPKQPRHLPVATGIAVKGTASEGKIDRMMSARTRGNPIQTPFDGVKQAF